MDYSAFINMNLLSEEAKKELKSFYEYLLFKYKPGRDKESPSKRKIEIFQKFADQHLVDLPEDYKFDREEANCEILYSEDLQHNQLIEKKLRIVNPFI